MKYIFNPVTKKKYPVRSKGHKAGYIKGLWPSKPAKQANENTNMVKHLPQTQHVIYF